VDAKPQRLRSPFRWSGAHAAWVGGSFWLSRPLETSRHGQQINEGRSALDIGGPGAIIVSKGEFGVNSRKPTEEG
jgi:hypothetical protein